MMKNMYMKHSIMGLKQSNQRDIKHQIDLIHSWFLHSEI